MVPEDCLAAARQLVAKYYRHYLFIERWQPRPEPEPPPVYSPPRSEIYRAFCRIVAWDERAPLSYTRAKALYRHAALRLHPDVGGSSDEMALLNEAWQGIKDTLA